MTTHDNRQGRKTRRATYKAAEERKLSAEERQEIARYHERQARFEAHEKKYGDTARMRARLGLS
jgi:hypothetical protein